MKKQINPRPFLLRVIAVLLVLLALGAFLGGGAFILAPDGHLIHMPISHLEKSPFPDFLTPGLILFTFLGIYPMAVVYSLWQQPDWHWPNTINPFKGNHWSWAASLAAGTIVIIWISVEMLWVPFGFVHILYLSWGVAILILTLHPQVRRYSFIA